MTFSTPMLDEDADAGAGADADVNVDDDGVGDGDEGDPWEEITGLDGMQHLRLRRGGEAAQRLGFSVRDRALGDVDDEIDVDGDDEGVFGASQFTEADITCLNSVERSGEKGQAEVEGGNSPGIVHLDTVMEVETEITRARRIGDSGALVTALERKVKLLVSA